MNRKPSYDHGWSSGAVPAITSYELGVMLDGKSIPAQVGVTSVQVPSGTHRLVVATI